MGVVGMEGGLPGSLSCFLPGKSFPGEESRGHDSGGNYLSQGTEGRDSRTWGHA